MSTILLLHLQTLKTHWLYELYFPYLPIFLSLQYRIYPHVIWIYSTLSITSFDKYQLVIYSSMKFKLLLSSSIHVSVSLSFVRNSFLTIKSSQSTYYLLALSGNIFCALVVIKSLMTISRNPVLVNNPSFFSSAFCGVNSNMKSLGV